MRNEEWFTVYTDVSAIRDKQETVNTQSQETLRSIRNGLQIRSNKTKSQNHKTTKKQNLIVH